MAVLSVVRAGARVRPPWSDRTRLRGSGLTGGSGSVVRSGGARADVTYGFTVLVQSGIEPYRNPPGGSELDFDIASYATVYYGVYRRGE
eukprot:559333-Prymnesium_polylepis.1